MDDAFNWQPREGHCLDVTEQLTNQMTLVGSTKFGIDIEDNARIREKPEGRLMQCEAFGGNTAPADGTKYPRLAN